MLINNMGFGNMSWISLTKTSLHFQAPKKEEKKEESEEEDDDMGFGLFD